MKQTFANSSHDPQALISKEPSLFAVALRASFPHSPVHGRLTSISRGSVMMLSPLQKGHFLILRQLMITKMEHRGFISISQNQNSHFLTVTVKKGGGTKNEMLTNK